MTEVILNDECMHCNDRECHNGEHFCNYAMKDNSFYKNAKLYKGLEVIQRPTYEDLEKENAELKKACDETQELLDKQIEATLKLDKENAELDCQKNRNKFCYSCVNATEKCFKNEISCPCDKYKSYKEELKKWKDEWQEQVQKGSDEGYARTLQTIQLTKAKEIIREFVEWATWQGNSKCPSFKSIQDKAEQFLKDSEAEK